MEWLCELCDISVNKNCVYGDANPMNPSGIRLGTSAMTTRGFGGEQFNECW
jgi:glycine hydroxymethyltransferase